jgi:hypothetical protein
LDLLRRVKPVIDETYPLSEAAVAHRYSESKRIRGKLVLIVDERLATGSGRSRNLVRKP